MSRRTMADAHPDFAAAPERRRYIGSLQGLFTYLSFESEQHPGTDCWRILPGGAAVSMKRKPSGMRILRISRREKPKTEAGPALWDRELATFVEKFQIPGWQRIDDDTAAGIAAVFHEEAPGPRCRECSGLLDATAIGAMAELCVTCAVRAKQIPAGWQQCGGDGCTNVIQQNPAFDVNHCQACAIAAGRRYSERRRA